MFIIVQIIRVVGHTVDTIVTTEAMLYVMKRGSGDTETAHFTKLKHDTKQSLGPIRGTLTTLSRANKEGDNVDTFQISFVVAEVSGDEFNETRYNVISLGTGVIR